MTTFESLFSQKEIWKSKFAWLNPNFWIMLQSYNREWDAELRELAANGTRFEHEQLYAEIKAEIDSGNQYYIDNFKDFKGHMANFGPYTLWIANYPYGTFQQVIFEDGPRSRWERTNHRPSRSTIYLLRKLLKQQLTDTE